MTTKMLFTAALLSGAAVACSAPASALTGNQYATQGRGVYTTSKGVPEGYYRHRGYEPSYNYRRTYRAPVVAPREREDFDPDSED